MVENIVQVFRYAVDYCATEADEYNRKLIHGVVGISVSVISALSSVALIVLWGKHRKTTHSIGLLTLSVVNICFCLNSIVHYGVAYTGTPSETNKLGRFRSIALPNLKTALEFLELVLLFLYAWFLVVLSLRDVTIEQTRKHKIESDNAKTGRCNWIYETRVIIITLISVILIPAVLSTFPVTIAWRTDDGRNPCMYNQRIVMLKRTDIGLSYSYTYIYRKVYLTSCLHITPMGVFLLANLLRLREYRAQKVWALGEGNSNSTNSGEIHQRKGNDRTVTTVDGSDEKEAAELISQPIRSKRMRWSSIPAPLAMITAVSYIPVAAYASYEHLLYSEHNTTDMRIAYIIHSLHAILILTLCLSIRSLRVAMFNRKAQKTLKTHRTKIHSLKFPDGTEKGEEEDVGGAHEETGNQRVKRAPFKSINEPVDLRTYDSDNAHGINI